MKIANKYNLTYKGITCIEVDWRRKLFTFTAKGYTFKYKQKQHIKSSTDNEHICYVIDEFLNEQEKLWSMIIGE